MGFVRLADHTVLTSTFIEGATVIDAGFNKGGFSNALLAQFNCRVIALEPLEKLVEKGVSDSRIILLKKALASDTGKRVLHEFAGHCASLYNHEDAKVKTQTTVDAISLSDLLEDCDIERVALLKLDIEGEEVDVLDKLCDATIQRLDQVTAEFHFKMFPHHRKSYANICKRFSSLGYYCHNFSTKPGTDTLFLRKELIDGFAPRLKLWSAMYNLGLKRVVRRSMSKKNVGSLAGLSDRL